MEKTMTPSAMTDGQIDKAVDVFRSQLRKHSYELPSDAVQTALGQDELGGELFTTFRKRVDANSNQITRRVKVDRTRTSKQVLDATGRNKYTDDKVVDAMPHGAGNEVEVCLFKLGRYVSDAYLDKEYALRGLVPADPYSLAAVNEVDPAFADQYPNGTHWKDAKGNWCFAAFVRWGGERNVLVGRHGDGWGDDWWFAGLRK
jgi:hypothetical protein